MILAALALMSATPIAPPLPEDNVHIIRCHDKGMDWQGSGWFVRDGVLATALHVADHDTCKDATTGQPIKAYKTDHLHDFALMSGSTGKSTIQYSCQRPKPKQVYFSFGYTSNYEGGDFNNPIPAFFLLTATKTMTRYIWGLANIYPMRTYNGDILHGMSGGPVTDENGVAYALNNAAEPSLVYLFDLADTALCTGKWDT